MATIEVQPTVLHGAARRVRALADQVRAESSAAGRDAAGWSIAALDERLPGCRAAEAAARAGVGLARACDSLADALDGLADALQAAASRYDETDRLVARW